MQSGCVQKTFRITRLERGIRIAPEGDEGGNQDAIENGVEDGGLE